MKSSNRGWVATPGATKGAGRCSLLSKRGVWKALGEFSGCVVVEEEAMVAYSHALSSALLVFSLCPWIYLYGDSQWSNSVFSTS